MKIKSYSEMYIMKWQKRFKMKLRISLNWKIVAIAIACIHTIACI